MAYTPGRMQAETTPNARTVAWLRDLAHAMLGSLIAHRGADDLLVLGYAARLREILADPAPVAPYRHLGYALERAQPPNSTPLRISWGEDR